MSQQEFCFIHAADLHLDTAFEGLRRVDAQVASRLRDASLAALEKLVTFTLESEARFLLLAGDIYDGAEHGVRAELHFLRAVERLAKHGVQVFIVHGNHDPLSGWSTISSWPEGVHLFPAGAVGAAQAVCGGAPLANIFGISYGRMAEYDNLVRRFPKIMPGPLLNIGLLHATVGAAGPEAAAALSGGHEPYSPCSLDDLREVGVDYWALGHIHLHQVLSRSHPAVVYPGTLQGRSMKPSECGVKGAVRVRARGNEIQDISFAPLDVVRFVRVPVDLSAAKDLAAARSAILAQISAAAGEHRSSDLVMRITLTGRSAVWKLFNNPDALDETCLALREQIPGGSRLLWCERVESNLRPEINIDDLRMRHDFPAELVAAAERISSDPAAFSSFAAAMSDDALRKAISRWLPSDGEGAEQSGTIELHGLDPALIEPALFLALELLEQESSP